MLINKINDWQWLKMDLNKKILVALAVLLTISYGLSMAAAGVSIPGCGECSP